MQNAKTHLKIQNFKHLSLILGIVLIFSLVGNVWLFQRNRKSSWIKRVTRIKKVSAQEIYPLFECPCCGKPVSECACSMAKERKAYIDGLLEAKTTKDEVVITYIRKYGLDSLVDKERQEEIREKLIKAAPHSRPIIVLTPSFYDLGKVSQRGGMVSVSFELKNEGTKDLIVEKLETSCGCTSASIVFKGEEGPKFSMPGHGVNENIKNWQVVIPPGEKAQLRVYYDPNVHQDFRGEVIREIYIYSNDPVDFEKKVQIELEQVD